MNQTTEERIDQALDWFAVGQKNCAEGGLLNYEECLVVLQEAKDKAKSALLALINEEREDEENIVIDGLFEQVGNGNVMKSDLVQVMDRSKKRIEELQTLSQGGKNDDV